MSDPLRSMCRALAFWLIVLAACRGSPELERVVNLVAVYPGAEVFTEPRRLIFGTSEARPHLVGGWSRDEQDRQGESFVWALGKAAELELLILTRRPLELRLRCRAYHVPGAPPQRLRLSLGEVELGEVEVESAQADYRFRLPVEALDLAGGAGRSHRLRLEFARSEKPSALGRSADSRPLAAAFYQLELIDEGVRGAVVGSSDLPSTPQVDVPRDRLHLPTGTRVDFYLDLPPRAELGIERWSSRGDARPRLGWVGEDGVERALEVPTDGSKPVRLPLDGSGGLAKLSLGSQGVGTGSVTFISPRVWAPAVDERAQATPAPPSGTSETASPPPRPNIVLYLIDTLRADHLGCYGYPRPTSPRIDEFASRAVLFEQAVAQSSWTKASVASLFTGLWPHAHATNLRRDVLSPAAETLPERLQRIGYRTSAFITNPNVTPAFGFEQGFGELEYMGEAARSAEVTAAVLEWLDRWRAEASEPFFLYLHTLDPHSPYSPPEEARQRLAPEVDPSLARRSAEVVNDLRAGRLGLDAKIMADLLALYDAEIAANDRSFGDLLDALQALGLYEETLIVLVSDHGEEFHEHGNFEHGRALHGESLRVPLIVKPAGVSTARRVHRPVQHIDILPTFLDLLGLAPDPTLEGQSLRPWLARQAETPAEPIYSYLHLDGKPRASIRRGRFKLIQEIDGGHLRRPRLFDLESDPGELENLAPSRPLRAAYLASLLRLRLAEEAVHASPEARIDDELAASLRALGYLQ